MPTPLLRAYERMLPRLQAERELRLLNAIVAGTGQLKRHAFTSYLRDLAQAAASPVRAQKATVADVRAMRIRVKEVPKRG